MEIFKIDEELRGSILAGHSTVQLRDAAVERGMITLRDAGVHRAMRVETSIEEILRVTLYHHMGNTLKT